MFKWCSNCFTLIHTKIPPQTWEEEEEESGGKKENGQEKRRLWPCGMHEREQRKKCWAQKMECCGYICMYVLLSIFCLLFPSHFSPPFTLLHPLLPLVTIFFFLNLFHRIHCYYQPTNSIRLNVNHNGGVSLSNYRDFILKVRTWDYWLRLSN